MLKYLNSISLNKDASTVHHADERQAVTLDDGINHNRVRYRVFERFRVKNDLLVSEMDDASDVRHDEDISSDDGDDVDQRDNEDEIIQ